VIDIMNKSHYDKHTKTQLGLINDATKILADIPDLKRSPTTKLGMGYFVNEHFKSVSESSHQLEILKQRVLNTQQRIGLPVLVGLMGRYSSGKSSLLNAFFNLIFEGNMPAYVRRKVGNTAVDDKFTYITHPDFKDRFSVSNDVVVQTIERMSSTQFVKTSV
jgi:hypothetical protein